MHRLCTHCRLPFTQHDVTDDRCPRCGHPAGPSDAALAAEPLRRVTALPTRFGCALAVEDGTAVVRPRGDLDLATVDVLDARLREARALARDVVLDLRGLDFADSSGIRLLLTWQRAAETDGFAFGLVRGGGGVHEVFALTGVEDLLRFVPA
jgi:anti-sigma B factor antagonist